MPLIQDLKNPAMRSRHWQQLKDEVQKPFDQESEEFTLEKIIELGLNQFSETVGDISTAASKELSIEQVQMYWYHSYNTSMCVYMCIFLHSSSLKLVWILHVQR